jgi:hypothetical protein
MARHVTPQRRIGLPADRQEGQVSNLAYGVGRRLRLRQAWEKAGGRPALLWRLLGAATLAIVLHAALLAGYVAGQGNDPGALVCVARERLGRAPYEAIRTGFDRNGYDGQFYYALARSPWRRHDTGIDAPANRHARLLYPALCWLFSGGDAVRLLWVMPLVNLLAVGILAGLGGALARRHGLSPWWGLLLPLAVNVGLPALRNLTDVLSSAAVCALLAAWLLRWPIWALALTAAAALFSREQNVLVVLLTLSVSLRRRGAIVGLLAALIAWAGWLVLLRLGYGEWPMLPTQGNMGRPLAGLLDRLAHPAPSGSWLTTAAHLCCLAALLLQFALAGWLLAAWLSERGRLARMGARLPLLVALAGAGLAIMGGVSLYGDGWSYTRVFAWLPLGVWVACVQARRRWALVALSLPVVLSLAVTVRPWLPGAG